MAEFPGFALHDLDDLVSNHEGRHGQMKSVDRSANAEALDANFVCQRIAFSE
jgi:hypothetical protein